MDDELLPARPDHRGELLLNESKLVARAVKGDTAAFGALFDTYAQDVYQVARSLGHRAGDAEDVMQDTFLAAFEGIGRYEGRSAFKTWLLAILFRQSSRRQRYLGIRKTEVFDESAPPENQRDSNTQPHTTHQHRLDVDVMLATLGPDHRAVVVLRELQGFTYDEIAQTLGVPRGTVESRLFRARALLRERFQEVSEDQTPSLAARPRKNCGVEL